MTKKILQGVVLVGVLFLAGCVPRRVIQADYGPRLDEIETRLSSIETTLDSLKSNVSNANDEILHGNMEALYKEVDELRAKMDMPLSKPRRKLVK